MNVSNVRILVAAGICLGASTLSAQNASGAGGSPAVASLAGPGLQIYGQVAGDYYVSPTGAFRINIPVLAELGGTITDSTNVVTFDDDFSTHCSVGAFPLSAEMQTELESRGTQGFLIYFFTNLVMPDFVARYPGATMEDVGSFLPEFQGGAMLIFTRLPGGSLFGRPTELWTPSEPVVAKRGNLCFLKNHHIFVVSIELAERSLERLTYSLTVTQENDLLRRRLLAIVARMEFAPAPEAGH